MPDETNAAKPGWYPTPDGGQRYWDGTQWLDLPTPTGQPSGSRNATNWRPSRRVVIAAAVVLILAVVGITSKMVHDSNVRSEQQAAQAAVEEAARVEADRIAKAAQDAAAAQDAKDSSERVRRALSVTEIENSVKTMAEGHVAKGLIDGPVMAVSCSPVSGGSTDDLTETTTVFSCFVSNKDNGDGTSSGYKYNSTMNWTTGSFTYGLGAP